MKKQPTVTRHSFVRLLLWMAGLLGLGGLVRYLSFQPLTDQPSRFELGDVTAYPIDSSTVRMDIPAVIYNQAGKISAYRLICTHLGCRVEEKGTEFECPCHGSLFDQKGFVIKGPAQKSLQAMDVEISEDNQLIIKVP